MLADARASPRVHANLRSIPAQLKSSSARWPEKGGFGYVSSRPASLSPDRWGWRGGAAALGPKGLGHASPGPDLEDLGPTLCGEVLVMFGPIS